MSFILIYTNPVYVRKKLFTVIFGINYKNMRCNQTLVILTEWDNKVEIKIKYFTETFIL